MCIIAAMRKSAVNGNSNKSNKTKTQPRQIAKSGAPPVPSSRFALFCMVFVALFLVVSVFYVGFALPFDLGKPIPGE